jgi:hypothetical protein
MNPDRDLPQALLPRPLLVALAALLSFGLARSATAAPTLGFQEDWPGVSVQNWGGGATYSNPGTGGVGGAGDGYLIMSTAAAAQLGTVSLDVPYAGNWTAAGIAQVKVWLNDIGTANPLEIHFSIGNGGNFWQYNPGFVPPHNAWAQFTVNLNASSFTQITGVGTFAAALAAVDRVHLRHDKPPFVLSPDVIQGDVGIDRLLLTNPTTAVQHTTWGRIQALYR